MDAKSSAKGWAIQAFGEFLGTAMFLYLAIGGADSVTLGSIDGTAYLGVAFAFGISLTVTAWAFFRISGAHFNPAITLSSLITGHITVPKAVLYFIAQILGGMLGVACARGTTPYNERIGQVNRLNNNESIARGFFLEFFLTTILCFVYHMIVHEKNRSTFMAALPYGFTLFSCYLFASRYTFASINPARAFATSVVARSFSPDHWIFWFGPLGGAILAAALHILFRFLDYDQHSAGIDAENQAQYLRAQAAANGGDVHNTNYTNNANNRYGTTTVGDAPNTTYGPNVVGPNVVGPNVVGSNVVDAPNTTYSNNNRYGPNGTTAATTTGNVLPR